MSDLVSIIVPIYGVEEYLSKCIDSIINQTYKNLEIILVDDGSPDKCPDICDAFEKKDERIKVIHKKNGGLSDARNAGIDTAHGDYIVFVDSDDWIENTMVEHLLFACKKYNVEMATCARYITDGHSTRAVAFNGPARAYSAEEALNEILLGKSMDVAAWDKIYVRNLFEEIRFPVGENNEDIAVFYKLVDLAGRVAHTGTTEYFYRSRPGSITKLKYSTDARKIIEKNLNSIEKFLDKEYPSCMPSFYRYKTMNIYALLNKYIKCEGTKKTQEFEHLMNEFRKNKSYFFNDDQTPSKEKKIAIMILLHLYNPYLLVKEKITGHKWRREKLRK